MQKTAIAYDIDAMNSLVQRIDQGELDGGAIAKHKFITDLTDFLTQKGQVVTLDDGQPDPNAAGKSHTHENTNPDISSAPKEEKVLYRSGDEEEEADEDGDKAEE